MVESTPSITLHKMLDRLRGSNQLVTHEFPEGLAVLIFLRWADFQEAEQEAIAAFDDTAYEPVLPASLHWRTWHQYSGDELAVFLHQKLSIALANLNNLRHSSLATHLHRLPPLFLYVAKLPPVLLTTLVRWLAEQPFETPADRRKLLTVFDDLLEFEQDKYRGEFQTPNHIAELVVALAAPSKGESIYDPCFGSARFLTSAIDYQELQSESQTARFGTSNFQVSGVELNAASLIIGLTRLVLAGVDDPHLEMGNSLERVPPTNPQQEGFDLVMANPPWGMTIRPHERNGLEHFPIMTGDATGLFIQHVLANLKPNGRAVMVVPNGILFKSGSEKRLREWLLDQHAVEAVIGLPEKAFMPSTAIKSSILVLRRIKYRAQVRMVNAEPFFWKSKGRQPTVISENQIHELVHLVQQSNESEYCWDVDVETLEKTGFDLTPRRRDKSALDSVLEELSPHVELSRLKGHCEIVSGRSIPTKDLSDRQPINYFAPEQKALFALADESVEQQKLYKQAEPVPYIRIRDVNKGQAAKGSSWLKTEAALGLDAKLKLKGGDVLLSKSGTIGKVGVVRNGAVGAVAANGFFVIRPDNSTLDPHYLAAYLDSGDCRSWFQDRATGSAISHLSRKYLDELAIALPPLQIQHKVAEVWRKDGRDALVYLAQLLTESEVDPISEWLGKELKTIPNGQDLYFDSPLEFEFLDQLSKRALGLGDQVVQNNSGNVQSGLVPWMSSFSGVMTVLSGISEFPAGSGMLSILQDAALKIKDTKGIFKKENLPSENKARRLTDFVEGWLDFAISIIFDFADLSFSVAGDSKLIVGQEQEITLIIKNEGLLALKNITLSLEPGWGQQAIKYLAEQEAKNVKITTPPPIAVGPFMLLVNWSAQALNGGSVQGTREIPFEIFAADTELISAAEDLGPSPYVCGDPVSPKRSDVFFGRKELLKQISRQIVQSGNVVLLEGNRRAGKSSILKHLEGVGPVEGWLGVYCSLQGAEGSQDGVGVPTAAVFREIATSIAKGLVALNIEVPLPDGSTLPAGRKLGITRACRKGISEDHPFADFRDYLEIVLDVTAEQRLGVLLMLDEFDKLQEGIDNGVTSPQVPENIRFMVQTYQGFSAVLTGSRRLKRLREEYWSALFGLGTRLGVTSLSPGAARCLVTEPVKGRLTYSSEAVEQVILLTNRQPFLLQSLCNRIFDLAAQLRIHSVLLETVEKAADQLSDDNEHFRSLWAYAETDRRRFILELVHKESKGPDPLRFGVIRELLSSRGVEVDDEALEEDLDFLRELELIEKVEGKGSDHYILSVPLMGRWIDRQHDFEVLESKARMETEDLSGFFSDGDNDS